MLHIPFPLPLFRTMLVTRCLPGMLLLLGIMHGYTADAQEFVNPLGKLKGKPGLIAGLDNRRIWVQTRTVSTYGVYVGLSFQKMLRYKLSFSSLPFERDLTHPEDTLERLSRFGYLSFGEEWDFFRYKRFTTTLYGQIGVGQHLTRESGAGSGAVVFRREMIFPAEGGLLVRYALLTWLDAKAGVGWRHVFARESLLNGPYLKTGLGVKINPLLEALHLCEPQ